jgi:hypothetical protein
MIQLHQLAAATDGKQSTDLGERFAIKGSPGFCAAASR